MEKIKYLGEILMRFGPSGLVGAHQITMTRYVDGETILTETAGLAEPVEAESLAGLVGQATADLVAANGTLRSQAAELQAQVDALTAQIAAGGGATDTDPTDLPGYAARKRWEVETGGLTVGGVAVDTSRDSQAMITGAYVYSQAHPEETISFKAASGWVSLDSAALAAIATAVGAHVQACFAAEVAVDAQIAAGTITTAAEIDTAFAAAM